MSKFITAAILLAAAGAVYADGMTIREVEVNHVKGRKCNPGQTVSLFGGPFLSKPDAPWTELSATINGDKANVTFASVDAISVPIPDDQGFGKVTLRIARAGANATVELTVVDPKKEQITAGSDAGRQVGPDAPDQVMATFSVTKVSLVRDGGKTRVDAEGTATRLLDNMNVTLSLERQGFSDVATARADVKGGAWKTTFGPWAKELPCGAWTVKLLFELPKQPKMLANRFREKLPADEKEAFDRVLRQDVLEVGTPEDEKTQRDQVNAHARAVATAAKDLFTKIDAAYMSGSRCFFRVQGQGFQAPKWETWLQEQKLCETPEQLTAARNDTRFGNANTGYFAADKWEKFVKDQILTPLQTTKETHATFSDGWVAPLNPTVDGLERELLAIVTERLRNTGQAMCDQSKVPLPDIVREIPAESVGQDQVSKIAFHAKWRLLLRTIGDNVPD